MKFLINSVITYKCDSVNEVERFHEELQNDARFTLNSFNYKVKQIKDKGEVVEEYYLVSAKLIFNDEKEPDTQVDINYVYDAGDIDTDE